MRCEIALFDTRRGDALFSSLPSVANPNDTVPFPSGSH